VRVAGAPGLARVAGCAQPGARYRGRLGGHVQSGGAVSNGGDGRRSRWTRFAAARCA